MSVPMMDVRIMWVAVRQPPVFVEMRVWLDATPREIALVPMVFVVCMPERRKPRDMPRL